MASTCGGGGSSPGTPAPTPTPAPKPNIVFIVGDDLDSQAMAFMPKVQSLLASQGLTFNRHFVPTGLLSLAALVACSRPPEGETTRATTPVAGASPTAALPEFSAPLRIKDVPPVYPKALLGSGRRGDVVLELRIDVTGKITSALVKESLGPEFDEAALAAARQWEYTPTIFKGKPALMYLTVSVPFEPPPSSGGPAR